MIQYWLIDVMNTQICDNWHCMAVFWRIINYSLCLFMNGEDLCDMSLICEIQMVQQYVSYGEIRELYVRISILEGNSFLRHESMPAFFYILMLMCFICTLHI